MQKYNIARDCAAQCQRKAKTSRNEDDMHSWLALSDSWFQTAKLQQQLAEMEAWDRHRAVA
jgi:hypothetical protein